jgi:hypothetical protein
VGPIQPVTATRLTTTATTPITKCVPEPNYVSVHTDGGRPQHPGAGVDRRDSGVFSVTPGRVELEELMNGLSEQVVVGGNRGQPPIVAGQLGKAARGEPDHLRSRRPGPPAPPRSAYRPIPDPQT